MPTSTTGKQPRGVILYQHEVKAILSGRMSQFRRVIKPCLDGFEWVVKHPGDTYTNTLWDNKGKQWETINIPVSCDCLVYTSPMQRCVNPTGSLDMEWFQWESTPHICPYGRPGDSLWVRESWQAMNQNCQWWHEVPRDDRPLHNWAWTNPVYPAYESAPPKWLPSIHMPRAACRITLKVVSVRVERLQDISEEDAKEEGIIQHRTYRPGYGFRDGFGTLWNEINGKRPGCSWDTNPYVWVVEFAKGGERC